jgi:hypothetical protein
MKNNSIILLDVVVMIHKIENRYYLLMFLFSDFSIKIKQFILYVKLLIGNKLTLAVPIRQKPETYPMGFFRQLGMNEPLAERSLYRTLERIGKHFPVFLERYHQFLKTNDLIDKRQLIDFSSS